MYILWLLYIIHSVYKLIKWYRLCNKQNDQLSKDNANKQVILDKCMRVLIIGVVNEIHSDHISAKNNIILEFV